MDMPRYIDTPRLHLRDLRPGDAQDVFVSYASDQQVLRYLGWWPHLSIDDSRRHIGHEIHRWLKKSAWVWALTRPRPNPKADRVFGQVELLPMSYPSEQAHHLRLGYLMASSHWGQGLMSEAVEAVLAAAFKTPGVWRVDALCDVANANSVALLELVGMVREGCMRRAVLHPNVADTPRDAWVYGLSRDAWIRLQQAAPANSADLACAERNR